MFFISSKVEGGISEGRLFFGVGGRGEFKRGENRCLRVTHSKIMTMAFNTRFPKAKFLNVRNLYKCKKRYMSKLVTI